ncbi:MAG: hypothetical protein KME32_17465 [Mojavia pulchra JT2-VF2]|uniref:Uncharacterized protein n=1 Tax=Mojavia pulchra JT2-VF2 TaxID=287848 RepID=A0A951Q019_9NOST|nr:hypothetical protein [Mojavia pulchra JT2-VF2]
MRQKLDTIEIHHPKLTQFFCFVSLVSYQFEHDIRLSSTKRLTPLFHFNCQKFPIKI